MCILFQTIGEFVKQVKTPRLQGSATVTEALTLMQAHETDIIGVECENEFVGVFRRKDYKATVIRQNLNPEETSLYEVMIFNPPNIKEDITVKEACLAMMGCQWDFMPVVSGKCLRAIVSSRDLGEHIMQAYERSEAESRMVMNYFKGGESYALADYYG